MKTSLILLIGILGLSFGYEVPAITSQHQNILRSYGNLGQVSTYSKSIDTPFSSVRKADVRVSNPGIAVATHYGHVPYAAPAYPAIAAHHSPAIVSPGYYPSHGSVYPSAAVAAPKPVGLLGVAYSPAPAVAHMSYTNGLGISYSW